MFLFFGFIEINNTKLNHSQDKSYNTNKQDFKVIMCVITKNGLIAFHKSLTEYCQNYKNQNAMQRHLILMGLLLFGTGCNSGDLKP
ncbi:hypothetical protein DDZ16_06380 [Marinilabilia rubra]|uniref:Uncharacterized protein n=1 Tax=Marinilabilia rubra TaxID=2162893 RepID=A0A2U2BAD0_9BACT|nr:hypothetical protein DDZ16_06380 [Marinilabilia rubra]